jgi:hypothetical protein
MAYFERRPGVKNYMEKSTRKQDDLPTRPSSMAPRGAGKSSVFAKLMGQGEMDPLERYIREDIQVYGRMGEIWHQACRDQEELKLQSKPGSKVPENSPAYLRPANDQYTEKKRKMMVEILPSYGTRRNLYKNYKDRKDMEKKMYRLVYDETFQGVGL